MPHTTTGTDTDDDHGWGWITTTTAPPIPLHPSTPGNPDTGDGDEWEWLTDQTAPATRPTSQPRTRIRLRATIIAGLTAIVATGVTTGALLARPAGHPGAAPAATTAPRSTSTPATSAACSGLTGATVTDRAGDADTVAGLIATFEFAYYTTRSVDQAMRTVAPDSGIVPQALAAGIASIPPGTSHCVAINPLAGEAADVHVVELHPDHTRVDYLQLVNTHRTPTGLVISNIQRQQ
ncbi:hypothetical protein [Nocardia jiangxiensis]|uniref:hypothetical protein n=1 Tax=Nocardia jiangxiensis TaxID=282685 RepID=UPI0002DB518D|nr:hypothetical protein [Nocardia jiangxiensis]